MPGTGIEPARPKTHAPETCASTNFATRAILLSLTILSLMILKSGKRDSNSRPQPWQGCALPTELFPLLLLGAKVMQII